MVWLSWVVSGCSGGNGGDVDGEARYRSIERGWSGVETHSLKPNIWAMPPTTMMAPRARLTMRLEQEARGVSS